MQPIISVDDSGKLTMKKYANQDTPLSDGLCPLLPKNVKNIFIFIEKIKKEEYNI